MLKKIIQFSHYSIGFNFSRFFEFSSSFVPKMAAWQQIGCTGLCKEPHLIAVSLRQY